MEGELRRGHWVLELGHQGPSKEHFQSVVEWKPDCTTEAHEGIKEHTTPSGMLKTLARQRAHERGQRRGRDWNVREHACMCRWQ